MKIEFEILNGLPSDDLFRPFNEYCRNQKDGSYYMEIKKRGKSRSPEQLKYYWVAIGQVCEQMGIHSFEKEAINYVHDSIKKIVLGIKEKVIVINGVKKTIKLAPSIANGNIEIDKMAYLIDRMIHIFAEWGYVITHPKDLDKNELDNLYAKWKNG